MVKTLPSNAWRAGSNPARGAKTPHALWPKNQNVKRKQCCKKFNKDFVSGPHQKKRKYTIHAAAAAAKLLQSCPTLCDPIDGSPLGSSVHGILQARTLEWVAISSSVA